ncbi:MAG: hypothetical protein IJA56_04670 [Clostridia bacterium]|nr:hypothetical protein [Clostridia bacterium]
MKSKLIAWCLVITMIMTLIPTVAAAKTSSAEGFVPDAFSTAVTLPLMEARTKGLYEEPKEPLPDPAEEGFLRPVEGWTPRMIRGASLPVAVTEPDLNAVPIATAAELQAITEGGSYVLTADIDLTGVIWEPKEIEGDLILDGQGYVIRGLSLTPTERGYLGLFGYLHNNMTVKNLRMESVTMAANQESRIVDSAGVLAGYVKQGITLQNVVIECDFGNKTQCSYQGIAAGHVYGNVVAEDCVLIGVDASFVEEPENVLHAREYFGGLVGRLDYGSSKIQRCYVETEICFTNEEAIAGGLIGLEQAYQGNSFVQDTKVVGSLQGPLKYCGGLWGYCSSSLLAENTVVEMTLGTQEMAGGLAGYAAASVQAMDCRFTGSIQMQYDYWDAQCGGLVGKLTSDLIAEGCAAEIDFTVPAGNEKLEGVIGGLVGNGERQSCKLERCAVDMTANGFDTDAFNIGGLAGKVNGSFRDCTVRLESIDHSFTHNGFQLVIGGLAGDLGAGVTVNCGVSVELDLRNDGDVIYVAGGLAGRTTGDVTIAKCYASGIIQADISTARADVYSVGGLIGCGYSGLSLGQCYGGVDLEIQSTNRQELLGTAGALAGYLNDVAVYSCWSDASVCCAPAGSSLINMCVGGLVGELYSTGSIQDSCFVGTLAETQAKCTGGILGEGAPVIRNCYAETDILRGGHIGGLVAYTGTNNSNLIYDSWFRGKAINAQTVAGGIIGEGGCNIYRCWADATVESEDQTAGGIAGIGYAVNQIEDCHFTGRVAAATVGGIVGDCYNAKIYDCTVEAEVDALVTDSLDCKVGGVAASAYWIENSHMKTPIIVDVHSGGDIGDRANYTHTVGGIAAENCYGIINCTSLGVRYSGSSNWKTTASIAGIVSHYCSGRRIENCCVEGDVRGTLDVGNLIIGGINATGYSGTIRNCWVDGDVYGYINHLPDETGFIYSVTIGGIAGQGSNSLILNNCYHAGDVDAVVGAGIEIYRNHPLVGKGGYKGGNSADLNTNTREDESYTVRVYWNEDGDFFTYYPLEGATVQLDGVSVGITSSDGSLIIPGNTIANRSLAKITAEKGGYFSGSAAAYLADGGVTNLYLMKKTEGKLYIRSAQFTDASGQPRELLTRTDTIWVAQIDTEAHAFEVQVDWNDLLPYRLYLRNEDGSHKLNLLGNQVEYIHLPGAFAPDEAIWLEAIALDGEGNPVTETKALTLKVKELTIQLPLNTAKTDFGGDDIYFMENYGFDIGFKNLLDYSVKTSFENGILKIDFGQGEEKQYFWGFFNEAKTTVYFRGNFEIPITDLENGEWKGRLGAAIEQNLRHDHQLYFKGIPILIVLEGSGEANGLIGVEGTLSDPGYTGSLNAKGDASLTIGPGLILGDREVSIRGGGNIAIDLPVEYHAYYKDGMTFEPSLLGSLIGKLVVKAGEWIDISGEIKLGVFSWNSKDGARWVRHDEESTWTRSARGGGGGGGRTLSTHLDSDAALAQEAGAVVLYYTADDGLDGTEGYAAEHTALWRTELQEDGTWAEAEMISQVGQGYPAMPAADGGYVTWINSPETDTLDGLLTSTEICVAQNGELIHTIDGEGYVYAPKTTVSSDGSSLLITWLRDPEVNEENILPVEPELHWAVYENGRWSQGVVESGNAVPESATPSWNSQRQITWKTTAGVLMQTTGAKFTQTSVIASGLGESKVCGAYTASISHDGVLTVWKDGKLQATNASGRNVSDLLMLQDEETSVYYVVWSQTDGIWYADSATSWNNVKLLAKINGRADGLTGTVVDGLPLVSWYITDMETDETTLYTAHAQPMDGVDLTVTELKADLDHLQDTGLVTLIATVTNCRETTAAGVAYTVTDEDGTVYASGTYEDTAVAYGETVECHAIFMPDVTEEHTYTLTVEPLADNGTALTDEEPGNNSQSVTLEAQAELVRTGFIRCADGGVALETIVSNSGVAPLESMTVEVYRADLAGEAIGEPLVTKTFTDVPSGSFRQVLMGDLEQDACYKVVLSRGNMEVQDTLLLWMEPGREGIWISEVDTSENGQITVNVKAQNAAKDVFLVLAVYEQESDRMVWSEMQDLPQWGGNRTATFDLEKVPAGKHNISLFLLNQENYAPLAEAKTDMITVD